jgi:hypothetical protein
MDRIDGLALQELRETCEEVLEGAVGEQVFDTKDAALIIALMDERDARLDAAPEDDLARAARLISVSDVSEGLKSLAGQDEAPEPEGLREALLDVQGILATAADRCVRMSDARELIRQAEVKVRTALARPAAAEGVERGAARLLRELISGFAGDYTVPSHWHMRAKDVVARVRALAPDEEQADG